MQDNRRNGAALLALALLFAAIGILFGLGRLKAHEYQVTRRINRQYQIEKMLVTRSALALIKYECSPDGTDVGFPVYSNLVYQSSNSCETLYSDIIPTSPVDRQEMKSADFTATPPVWRTYTKGATVAPWTDPADNTTVVKFAVKNAATNKLYKCAIFKKAERFWLGSEFGYLYRLHMKVGGAATGFGALRLYLVGTGDNADPNYLTTANFTNRLASLPSIMMELTLQNGTTNGAVRTLRVNNGKGQVDYPYEPILIGAAQGADQITHGGGFLLSGTAMVGFGESFPINKNGHSKEYADLYFSNRYDLNRVRDDLNRVIDIPSFSNSWVVIEHVFPTNMPGKDMSITIDSFVMREPTTYSISVYNKALATDTNIAQRLMTWVFQTQYPVPGYDPPKVGKQCALDTFGAEPVSLKKERRGLSPY